MVGNIDTTSSSVGALSQQYETITSNLANTSTVGYKRRLSRFEETMQGQTGSSGGDGTVTVKTPIDFTQGTFIQTNRPLDLAINGKGFFTVETPDGKLYTRNGAFTVNAEGRLVDTVGQMVAGENGQLTIPQNTPLSQITVSADGDVSANGQSIGKLRIVDFADKSVLQPVGSSSFTAPDTAEPTSISADAFRISQGVQEGSNVNIVKELVGLITVSRMYEANLKTVSKKDDRLQSLMQVAMA
jgi:flagellar basal-body rod protein FlgF